MMIRSETYTTDNRFRGYLYSPKLDITTYELAQIILILTASSRDQRIDVYRLLRGEVSENAKPLIEKLDESCKRHFQLQE